MRCCWGLFVFGVCLASPGRLPATSFESEVESVVQQVCIACHDAESSEGGLDLTQLPLELQDAKVRQHWVQIHDRIALQEMPPDPAQLPDDRRARVLATLSTALHAADLAAVRLEGRGPLRRLTRDEFEANLRDLLDLPQLDVRDLLPEERAAYQSNKVSESLDITRVQLNAFLDAADTALREAVAKATQPPSPMRYHALATKMFPKAIDHAGRESSFYSKEGRMIPLTSAELARIRRENTHDPEVEIAIFRSASWPYYGYPEEFLAPADGQYQVRFEARAVRQVRDFRLLPGLGPQPMTFRARQPSAADVSGDVRATGGVIDVLSESQVYETTVLMKRGETIEYSLLGLPVPFPITSHGGPLYYDFPPMPSGGHPGIAFRWIEIVGPLVSTDWPPNSHRVLFDDLPLQNADDAGQLPVEVLSDAPRADAERLLRRFVDRAARRSVPDQALEVYLQLFDEQLAAGSRFGEAMLAAYKAFLCSGHFLFLHEPRDSDDHSAIAQRLSHFLWNSKPDRRLMELAEERQLRHRSVLRAETSRLIADERFQLFVRNFTDYWLDLRELQRDAPDIRLYPEYRGDDYLIESMGWETRAFVTSLFRDNLPVTTLVDSDFAMLNDRLSMHYELSPLSGSSVRKVRLPPGSARGGLLAQAAVLKVTANGTTTSPVTRGAWVMDRLLGDPPPPPPPNVPAVEPDLRGVATIREILAAHASEESCAACHRGFDPVGLALERFDILGARRDRYRSLESGDEITGIDRAGHKYSYRVAAAVESSGQLEDGRSFADVRELKTLLAANPRQLARNLLERLTTYGTGTPPRFSDRLVLESILDATRDEGYRVRDLLNGLLQSRIFLGEPGLIDEQADRISQSEGSSSND